MTDTLTAPASRAADRNPSSHAGAKVTVASKLPHALILRTFKMVSSRELVLGGGSRDISIAEQQGEGVIVNGVAKRVEHSHACMVIGGYALTPNVPKDLWDQWLADNKDSAMVRNGLVFAHEKQDHVEGRAREQAEIRSNMEPMLADPKQDPRAPRSPEGMTVEVGQRAA